MLRMGRLVSIAFGARRGVQFRRTDRNVRGMYTNSILSGGFTGSGQYYAALFKITSCSFHVDLRTLFILIVLIVEWLLSLRFSIDILC
jgi:hypothetical protein